MEPAEYRPDDVRDCLRRVVRGLAAMEPAEYRPDDNEARVFLQQARAPQWSRPSIGRMTSERECRAPHSTLPQWSRPSIGRMTGLSSGSRSMSALPQWSRPSIGRMTARLMDRYRKGLAAAMEPAEYRPDDNRSRGVSGQVARPQWSRPSIGRMTYSTSLYQHAKSLPQWSRPSIGR